MSCYPVNYMDVQEAERSSLDPTAAAVCPKMCGTSCCHQEIFRGTYIFCSSAIVSLTVGNMPKGRGIH